jgi:hypothetical protein
LNSGSTSSEYLRKRSQQVGLSNTVTQEIIQTWNNFEKKIGKYLISKVLSKNRLVDLDWSFGVTSSTEEQDHVGKTFLQLKLVIDDDEQGRRVTFLEMSVDQFYQFLASLEKCRTFLDFINPH